MSEVLIMRDSYAGDVGDYAKFGALRRFSSKGLTIAINWYYVRDARESGRDGKFINYLRDINFSGYDDELFGILKNLTIDINKRDVRFLEKLNIGAKIFHADPVPNGRAERTLWHKRALDITSEAQIIFLDPDNGLASEKMTQNNACSIQHVLWNEIRDYYNRGQSVLLYQHRPRRERSEKLIDNIRKFNDNFLKASAFSYGDFSCCQNRYLFLFSHENHKFLADDLKDMEEKWNKTFRRK